MHFLQPIDSCVTSTMEDEVLASMDVKTGKRRGRHAIAVVALGECRVGNETVLQDKEQGIRVSEGETMFFPVTSTSYDQLWVKGPCTLIEFF